MIGHYKSANVLLLLFVHLAELQAQSVLSEEEPYAVLLDRNTVADKKHFPYVVAVLKMTSYLSAGAMIKENWILTAADGLYLYVSIICRRINTFHCSEFQKWFVR